MTNRDPDVRAEMKRPDRPPDWSDRHVATANTAIADARSAYLRMIRSMPAWAKLALFLRNRVAAPFGLRTEGAAGGNLMETLPVVRETAENLEVGLVDKHLTFTIETSLSGGRAVFTTRIWFNHWSGRLYLVAVLLPHKMILRHSLRGLA
jgi:hypothetical protein